MSGVWKRDQSQDSKAPPIERGGNGYAEPTVTPPHLDSTPFPNGALVESTINEVVAKGMVKKQRMQWSQQGAHYLLQTRTSVLNGELKEQFRRWYPGLKIDEHIGEKTDESTGLAA